MTEDAGQPPKPYQEFVRSHPEIAAAYEQLGAAVRKGPLTEREIGLVKLALSVGARMEGPTHAHTRKALVAGIEDQALEQVALLGCPTLGFPHMMAGLSWIRDITQSSD